MWKECSNEWVSEWNTLLPNKSTSKLTQQHNMLFFSKPLKVDLLRQFFILRLLFFFSSQFFFFTFHSRSRKITATTTMEEWNIVNFSRRYAKEKSRIDPVSLSSLMLELRQKKIVFRSTFDFIWMLFFSGLEHFMQFLLCWWCWMLLRAATSWWWDDEADDWESIFSHAWKIVLSCLVGERKQNFLQIRI